MRKACLLTSSLTGGEGEKRGSAGDSEELHVDAGDEDNVVDEMGDDILEERMSRMRSVCGGVKDGIVGEVAKKRLGWRQNLTARWLANRESANEHCALLPHEHFVCRATEYDAFKASTCIVCVTYQCECAQLPCSALYLMHVPESWKHPGWRSRRDLGFAGMRMRHVAHTIQSSWH